MKTQAWAARRYEAIAGFGLVAPALLVIGLLFVLPAAAGLVISLTDFDLYAIGDASNARFVGLQNYRTLLQDSKFWNALWNTFYFVFAGGPLSIVMSLAAAMLVSSRLTWFKGIFRTVYFAPYITTLVAVSLVWRYLYHPQFGIFNRILALVGLPPVDWLGDPRWAMPAIILMAVWKNFGYNMIIFMAALQNIPEQLYEAAKLDGAGLWHQFRHITLPMIRPSSVFVAVTTMIGYFQFFAEPYVMTRGGPLDSTVSIVLLMYKEGFRWWNMGYAASVAFILFLIIIGATAARLWLQKRRAS